MKEFKVKIAELEKRLAIDYKTYKKQHPKTKKSPSDPIFHVESQGYKIDHDVIPVEGSQRFLVISKHPEEKNSLPGMAHGTVGYAEFSYDKKNKHLVPEHTEIHSNHQRKGLASAMYAHAEKHTKFKIRPSRMQSEEAKKFWKQRLQKP